MFERQNVITAATVAVAAWVRPDPPPTFRWKLTRPGCGADPLAGIEVGHIRLADAAE